MCSGDGTREGWNGAWLRLPEESAEERIPVRWRRVRRCARGRWDASDTWLCYRPSPRTAWGVPLVPWRCRSVQANTAAAPSPEVARSPGGAQSGLRIALVVACAHTVNDMYASFVPPLLPRIMGELGLSIASAATLAVAFSIASVNVQMVGLDRVGEHGATDIAWRGSMNHAKALEYRITRSLLRDREPGPGSRMTRVAEIVIRLLAVSAAVALVGAHVPELLWAGVAASIIYTLGAG